MKRHGLWQFHRAIRSTQIKWWTNDEFEHATRHFEFVSCRYTYRDYPYRDMDAVIRCANRYMRRYSLKRNVESWNSTCNLICDRMGAHAQTRKAVTHAKHIARGKTLIDALGKDDLDLPYPRHYLMDIRYRLNRLKEMQRKRLDSICCVCKKNTVHESRYLHKYQAYILGIENIVLEHSKCCTHCHLRLCKLIKKFTDADDVRLLTNRIRRRINESAKNNARTT